jgi:hypothetical protein
MYSTTNGNENSVILTYCCDESYAALVSTKFSIPTTNSPRSIPEREEPNSHLLLNEFPDKSLRR